MKRFLMILALGGVIVSGCGDDDGDDDDDTPTPDSSVGDSSVPRNDGGTDAGRDSGIDGGIDAGPMTVTCGGQMCTGHTTGLGMVAPGCALNAADAQVCGISSASLGGPDAGIPPFVEKDAPGVASSTCGAFYDSLEADGGVGKGNGKINTILMTQGLTIPLTYPGCCTRRGFCSGDTSMGVATFGGSDMPSNGGYGCMDSRYFFRSLPEQVRAIPCDPTTGIIRPAVVPDGGAPGDAGVADASGIDSGS